MQTAIVSLGQDANPFGEEILDSVRDLREEGQDRVDGTGLRLGVTGSAAQNLDSRRTPRPSSAS